MSSYETLILSRESGVGIITLNRPEKMNAMSIELFDELGQVVDEVAQDEDIKSVIITGAGQVFSAGGDIEQDILAWNKRPILERQACINYKTAGKIAEMEKPVIAAINGLALGGGLDVALLCDIRFASQEARFSCGFIRVGLISDLGGNYFLPRIVGVGKAKLLEFTGDFIDAQEAERIGLVDKVFPPDELMPAAKQLAQRLAQGPTRAIAFAKTSINKSLSMDLNSSLEYCANLQCMLLHSEDLKEAATAFLEKRKPVFKGR